MNPLRRRRLVLALSTMAAAWLATCLVAEDGQPTALYFEVEAVNPNLELAADVNLETPLACVEQFVLSAREGRFGEAAAALDFRLHEEIDEARAAEIAERFFFVLNQELWIDWGRLPDRPDGLEVGSVLGQQDPMAGRMRRSLHLGSIEVAGRSIPIGLQRVKPRAGAPVWLFSAHTVDNVDVLWEAHGPSWLANQMPGWARQRGYMRVPLWQWLGVIATLVLAPIVGFFFSLAGRRWINERFSDDALEMCKALQWPLGATLAAMLTWLVLDYLLGLPSEVATIVEPLSLIIFVSMAVWLTMRIATLFVDRILKTKIRDHHEEESASRKRLLTQVAVARHVLLLVLVLIGFAVVLLQLDVFRTLGVTMLTSAGALAVILSIAGRAVLGNLIAGLQIALAQPFRIGDTVHVEGNWGYIEDITYVDVIVRTWDERRLVFPVGYFISNWFENWSKTDPYLVRPTYLQVDYRADVDAIRKRYLELVEQDEDWIGEPDEPEVLVTSFNEETVTVRLTAGGADPGRAWSLACRTREAMMKWLQEVEDGRYLPRRRLMMTMEGDPQPESS